MTGTPARDALMEAERNLFAHWMQGHFDGHPVLDHENGYSVIRAVLTDQLQPFVIAALVEAGWRPSDEELRAMGLQRVGGIDWCSTHDEMDDEREDAGCHEAVHYGADPSTCLTHPVWAVFRPEEDPHG